MYEDIRNNKIKTGVIVAIFLVVITLIVYYICMAFDLGYMSIVIAMIFAIGTSICNNTLSQIIQIPPVFVYSVLIGLYALAVPAVIT